MVSNSIESMAKNYLIACVGSFSESYSYDVSDVDSFDFEKNVQGHWYTGIGYINALEKARVDLLAWVQDEDQVLSSFMADDLDIDNMDVSTHYNALMYAVGMIFGYAISMFHDDLLEGSSEWIADHVFTKDDKEKLVEMVKYADCAAIF